MAAEGSSAAWYLWIRPGRRQRGISARPQFHGALGQVVYISCNRKPWRVTSNACGQTTTGLKKPQPVDMFHIQQKLVCLLH